MVGSDALDWLFVPKADVWIPDMVKTEATRAQGNRVKRFVTND